MDGMVDNSLNSSENVQVCPRLPKIDTIILLAKSECNGVLVDNEYSIEIETICPSVRTYFISPNQFEFINIEILAEKISSPSEWSGIILTSKRCVDALIKSIETLQNFSSDSLSKQWKFFTIGKATKIYLNEKLGFDSIGHHTGNSETLAKFILELSSKKKFEKPLIYPCSRIRSDRLSDILSKEINIEEVICYDTIPNVNLLDDLEKFKSFLLEQLQKLDQNQILKLVIVFFSSSGVDNLLGHLRIKIIDDTNLMKNLNIKIVALGKQTESKIESNGMDVWFVASAPSSKSMADKPEHKILLESWLNKNMRIKLSDNRIIVGIFLCTDCHQNVILGSSHEYLSEEDNDYRVLGLAMIPGQHIVSIYVDELVTS